MALVFDFDGVLVDTRNENMQTINNLAQKYRFEPLNAESYRNMTAYNFYEYWQMFLGTQSKDFFADLRWQPRPHPDLLPGMKTILEAHQPSIVSSNFSDIIRSVLAKNGITVPVYGGDVDMSKVRKLNHIKGEPDVFVTDTAGDVFEGKQAGYTIIAVTWGFNTRDMLLRSKPHHIVQTPHELHEELLLHTTF